MFLKDQENKKNDLDEFTPQTKSKALPAFAVSISF